METLSQLRDVFCLDPSSPSGLRWAVSIASGNFKIQALAGDTAGYLSKSGYWMTKYKNKAYQCHKLIWLLVYGEIANGFEVDHKDRNRANNKISNLRLVTHAVNGRNQKMRITNTSGVTGVSIIDRGHYILYQARWRDLDGREKSKSFSSAGFANPLQMAIDYREQKLEELNRQGAGYTENHGKVVDGVFVPAV